MTEGGESIQNLTYPMTGAHPYGTLISYKKKIGIFTAKKKKIDPSESQRKKSNIKRFFNIFGLARDVRQFKKQIKTVA